MSTDCDSLRSDGRGVKCNLFLLVESHAPTPEGGTQRRSFYGGCGIQMGRMPGKEFVHNLWDVRLLHRS